MTAVTQVDDQHRSAWRLRVLVILVWLSCGLSALAEARVGDSCALSLAEFEARSEPDAEFESIGSRLAFGPRLHAGLTEVRFQLPPVDRPCWLQIDRTSMYGLVVRVEGLEPAVFEFFRPGQDERFTLAGFTVAIPPHKQPRQVMLEITHLGSVSTSAARVDEIGLLMRERRTVLLKTLSVQVPVIMALLMLVFWLRLKDRALAAYVGLLVAIVLVGSSLDGTLYLLPVGAGLAGLKSMAHMVLLSLFGVAIILFMREFLAPLDRRSDLITRLLGGLFACTALASTLRLPVFDVIVMHVVLVATLLTVPLLFWLALRSLRAGNRLAIYFLVGWSLPVLAIPLRMMAEYGLIDWGFWIRYAPRLALMLEALIFALGLADRILRIRIERDRAEQLRLRSERALSGYQRLVSIDALTALASRRALDEALARWTAEGQDGSVLFIDIDHFKRFNDSFGHAEGDAALRETAARLREVLPESALLARYGGEEMVALLPAVPQAVAADLAEALRRSIELGRNGPQRRQLTVSIGVAERRPDETAHETVARADGALYLAKAGGRNQVAWADAQPRPA